MGADCPDDPHVRASTASVGHADALRGRLPAGDGVRRHRGGCDPAAGGVDYRWTNGELVFSAAPGVLVDCRPQRLAGRFTPDGWSNGAASARPSTNGTASTSCTASRCEMRLDPNRLKVYSAEPVVRETNGEVAMWLGLVRIVGASCRWDPSSGKLKSDVSSLSVVLQDDSAGATGTGACARGASGRDRRDRQADHRRSGAAESLTWCARWRCRAWWSRPTAWAPSRRPGSRPPQSRPKVRCGVQDEMQAANKNRRILEAVEGPLNSGQLSGARVRHRRPGMGADARLEPGSAGPARRSPRLVGRGHQRNTGAHRGHGFCWNPPAQRRDH